MLLLPSVLYERERRRRRSVVDDDEKAVRKVENVKDGEHLLESAKGSIRNRDLQIVMSGGRTHTKGKSASTRSRASKRKQVGPEKNTCTVLSNAFAIHIQHTVMNNCIER